jgi:hypothetical protein
MIQALENRTLARPRAEAYERIKRSELLPELDRELLTRCLLLTSPLEAIKEFRQKMIREYLKASC